MASWTLMIPLVAQDNNCAIMQHNKGRIAVKSDEEDISKKRIHQKKIRRRMKQESIHGEELKTEIISVVKNLKQNIKW